MEITPQISVASVMGGYVVECVSMESVTVATNQGDLDATAEIQTTHVFTDIDSVCAHIKRFMMQYVEALTDEDHDEIERESRKTPPKTKPTSPRVD